MSEPFLYKVPSDVLRNTKRLRAIAWKSACPGIIVQVPVDSDVTISELPEAGLDDLQVHLVHEGSGCVLGSFFEYQQARKIAGVLAGLPLNCATKTAQEFYLEVGKLDNASAKLFFTSLGLAIPKNFSSVAADYAANHEKRRTEWVGKPICGKKARRP
jgi:hypothetical protein